MVKPLLIDLFVGSGGGEGGALGYAHELGRMNRAADVAGACYIVAGILALIGAVLMVRVFVSRAGR
ncbi:MAG TPA: hypothetical protein ENJ24_02660 [Gammaproteobacteria bacterium]|nr:hypothetical protein [Gammaproteobacteria bacterium]